MECVAPDVYEGINGFNRYGLSKSLYFALKGADLRTFVHWSEAVAFTWLIGTAVMRSKSINVFYTSLASTWACLPSRASRCAEPTMAIQEKPAICAIPVYAISRHAAGATPRGVAILTVQYGRGSKRGRVSRSPSPANKQLAVNWYSLRRTSWKVLKDIEPRRNGVPYGGSFRYK